MYSRWLFPLVNFRRNLYMKRILILFLVLAVAGGLFAQSLTWSGGVVGGLAMTLADGADDPAFGTGSGYTLTNGNNRLRANGVYANADGTAGGRFRLQAQGDPTNWALSVPYAWGWMTFSDGFLKVLGGRITELEFNSVGSWLDNTYFTSAYGLQAYVYPSDTFRFGVGARASDSVLAGKNFDIITPWVGLAADLDTFSMAAQLEAGKDDINAFISAAFSGIDDLDLDVEANFSALHNFSDEGEVDAALYVGYSGIDRLSLYAAFNPTIPMASGSDMILSFGAGLEYEATDLLTAILDVDFVLQGGEYDGFVGWDPTYAKGDSYLGIKPTLQFKAASSANFYLGYALGVNLGGGTKLNHAAFLDFVWSF